MTDRNDFEHGFERRLRAHASRSDGAFDAVAITAAAVASTARRGGVGSWLRPDGVRLSTLRVGLVAALLATAVATGTLLIGGVLRQPSPLPDRNAIVVPEATATPVTLPDTEPTPTPRPGLTSPPTPAPMPPLDDAAARAAGVGVGPCAPMVQLYGTWAPYEPDPPVTLGPARSHTNGFVLFADTSDLIQVIDTRAGNLEAPRPDPIPDAPGLGFPIANGGRFVPAPDGQAIAVEEGDLGPAGCGEPVIRYARGGYVRPFRIGAFQTLTDLAWAPDGSALYGVLRATIDANGNPLLDSPDESLRDPGTILRWDARTRAVSNLGTPCAACRLGELAASPDGARLFVQRKRGEDVGLAVRDESGVWRDFASWRGFADQGAIAGWTADGLMVHDGYDHVDVVDRNGKIVTTSGTICCHGNGYGPLVSPDGTTVVGSSLRADFQGRDIISIDLRTGAQHAIATMWSPGGQGLKGAPSNPVAAEGIELPLSSVVAWAPDGRSLLLLGTDPEQPGPAKLRSWTIGSSAASAPLDLQVSVPAPVVPLAWIATLP